MVKKDNNKSAGKNKKMTAKKRKKLIINSVIVIIILISSYFLDNRYNIISDFINDNIINSDNADVQETVNIIERAENELLIHFVDVGQGDCIIIELPDGKNMIIDGGPTAAKNKVLKFIEAYNITVFDYLMLTHTDEDHSGSLDDVILNTDVKKVYKPDDIFTSLITTAAYGNFINAVNAEGLSTENIITTIMGNSITGNNYEILFFTPSTQDYWDVSQDSDVNTNVLSPIIILTYGGKRVMFTGDATDVTEELFLAAPKNYIPYKDEIIDVDILKVAHHGSNTSSTPDFLAAVKPEISVISVGADNSYGHPEELLLSRLAVYSEKILRTDLLGDITIKLTPDELGLADITIINSNSNSQNVSGLIIKSSNKNLILILFIGRKYIFDNINLISYIN